MGSLPPPIKVKIPAKEHRPGARLDRPDRQRKDGNAFIEALAFATLKSLPQKEVELTISAEPPAKRTLTQTAIRTVLQSQTKGSAALQLPEFLLSLQWAANHWYLCGSLNLTSHLDEDDIRYACRAPHAFLARMVGQQLEWEDEKYIDLLLAWTDMRVAAGVCHAYDVALAAESTVLNTAESTVFSFIEVESPVCASKSWWDEYPFTPSDTERELLITLDRKASQHILNECILKAQYVWTKSKSPVLVALTVPPIRLYYLLIDFDAGTVTVSDNIIAVKTESGILSPEAALQRIVDPEAWVSYWKAILWFHFVALALSYPEIMQKAFEADAMRDSPRLPPGLPQRLQEACDVLRTVPPPTLRVSMRLKSTWWIHCLTAWFVGIVQRLWIGLTWRTMSADRLLSLSKYLVIPGTGTLDLRNDSDPQHRWCSAILPPCDEKWGYYYNKRFYVYPSLKVFVKIFLPSALKEFKTEVKIFNRLADMQGKGIPRLYGSGKITDSDELCLVMSYEGEPLEEWNDESRSQVERLVGLLHAHEVHHHDVARRNVLVDDRGNFTLIDFEVSKEQCQDSWCTEEKNFGIDEEEDAD